MGSPVIRAPTGGNRSLLERASRANGEEAGRLLHSPAGRAPTGGNRSLLERAPRANGKRLADCCIRPQGGLQQVVNEAV
jgi:hypothetical protein